MSLSAPALGFRSIRGRPRSVRGRLRFSFSLGFRRSVVPSFRCSDVPVSPSPPPI